MPVSVYCSTAFGWGSDKQNLFPIVMKPYDQAVNQCFFPPAFSQNREITKKARSWSRKKHQDVQPRFTLVNLAVFTFLTRDTWLLRLVARTT